MSRAVLLAFVIPNVALARPSTTQDEGTARTREGITVDVSAGLGWIRTSPTTAPSYTSGVSLALNAGAGVWLTPSLVIGGRFAGVSNFEGDERLSAHVIGPNAQLWLDERLWIAVGLGVGVLLSSTSANELGYGFDLRAGLIVSESEHHLFSAAIDVTPARFSADVESATLTGIALVVCMQYR